MWARGRNERYTSSSLIYPRSKLHLLGNNREGHCKCNGGSRMFTLSSNCSKKRSIPRIMLAMFSCVSTTPLGSPLVPLVYIIVQMLKAWGGIISEGLVFPWGPTNSYDQPKHAKHWVLRYWVRIRHCKVTCIHKCATLESLRGTSFCGEYLTYLINLVEFILAVVMAKHVCFSYFMLWH